MKIHILMMIVLLMAMASCRSMPEYPTVISDTDDFFKTHSSLVTSLGVVGVFSGAYHLEDGYSREKGKELICLSRDKQYTVAFYKPKDGGLILVGEPVPFGDKHPTKTVYNDRPAVKGFYKGKKRIAYVDSGQLVIEDE